MLQSSTTSSLEAIKAKLHKFQQVFESEKEATPSVTQEPLTNTQTGFCDFHAGQKNQLSDAGILTVPSYRGGGMALFLPSSQGTQARLANHTSCQNTDFEPRPAVLENRMCSGSVSSYALVSDVHSNVKSSSTQSAADIVGKYPDSVLENYGRISSLYQQTANTTRTKSFNFLDGTSTRELTDTQHTGTQNTGTATFEVEDHITRMKQIEKEGNSPQEWTAYINFLKSIPSKNSIISKPLSEAYSRAFYGILKTKEHRDSEAFASIIMEYVQFKSDRKEIESADAILDIARTHTQNYAAIVVAAAEIKIMKGDYDKGLSILTKALSKGKAQPKELLIRALKAAESGEVKLLSEHERSLEGPWIFEKSGFQDRAEVKGCNNLGSCSGYTVPSLDSVLDQGGRQGLAPFMSMDITEPPITAEPPSSASKPGLRHYSSTPEVRAFMGPRYSSSQLQSSKLKGILGKPMRVRNPLQQHAVNMLSAEKEDDTDFSNSFRPLAPLSTPASGLFRSSSSTSGYNSDLTLSVDDSNLSLQSGMLPKDEDNSAFEKKQFSDTVRKQHWVTDQRPTGEINPSLSIIAELETPISGKIQKDSPCRRTKSCEEVLKTEASSGCATAVSQCSNAVSTQPHGCTLLQAEGAGGKDNGGEQRQAEPVATGSRVEDRGQREVGPAIPARTNAKMEVSSSASSWQGAIPVMSTPSCKNQASQDLPATTFQTPKPEFIESIVVNAEHYCILKKVGRGGSAQVYMVFDSKKNVRALKVVDLEGAGKEVIDGYRNEISLLQRLQYCDSVIKMYNFEYNEQLNRLFVVLEFGETDLAGFFATRAKQQCGMDPTTIKFYWREMLRAVHALHQEGIIHSDLKPANFMLVAGNLKLIDFGIANALQQDKTSVLKESRVGTPSYMSPEAIMAACDEGGDDSFNDKENIDKSARPKYKIGKRSDVWSLGCILYNMVYGRTPFQHIKNNLGKLQAITNPNHAVKFPPIPDPQLLDVLQKCLIRDAKSRPTTEELLGHAYLKSDKDSATKIPTDKGSNQQSSDFSGTPEPLRLKEQLKTHVAQGCSPGTKAVIMSLLQKLDKAGS